MSVIRAFIAIDLTPEIYQQLAEVAADFNELLDGYPIRWVPATNIHLTLKFLGDVSISNLDMLTDILKTEVSNHNPFEMSVGGSGAFPSTRRPRVVWVGIEAPPELNAVQMGIENEMSCLGYSREKRPFNPHLTIGRVSRNAGSHDVKVISDVVIKHKVGFLGVTKVKEIYLYKSVLKPSGAEYTKIFTAHLSD
jgi:2'-5' RNA ligase